MAAKQWQFVEDMTSIDGEGSGDFEEDAMSFGAQDAAASSAHPSFRHYRRRRTEKAPRKRTFVANMEKYNAAELGLGTAATGVGFTSSGAGSAGFGGGMAPPNTFAAGPWDNQWGANAQQLDPLAAMPVIAAPAVYGVKELPFPNPPSSALPHHLQHTQPAGFATMGSNGLASYNSNTFSSGPSAWGAPEEPRRVGAEMFPELAALAGMMAPSQPAQPQPTYAAVHSRAVVTSSVEPMGSGSLSAGSAPVASSVVTAESLGLDPAALAALLDGPSNTSLYGANAVVTGVAPPPSHAKHAVKPAAAQKAQARRASSPSGDGSSRLASPKTTSSLQQLQQQQQPAGIGHAGAVAAAVAAAAAIGQGLQLPPSLLEPSAKGGQGLAEWFARVAQAASALAAAAATNGQQAPVQGQQALPAALSSASSGTFGAALPASTGSFDRSRSYGQASQPSASTGTLASAGSGPLVQTAPVSAATGSMGRRPSGGAQATAAAAAAGVHMAGITAAAAAAAAHRPPFKVPLHSLGPAGVVMGGAGEVAVSRLVSVGAYGMVYRGRLGERDVAVKLMRTPLGPSDPLTPDAVLRSFRHEAAVLRRLSHPHIVPLVHAQDVEPACIVQDFARYGTLSDYIHGAPSPAVTEFERAVLTRLARRVALPPDRLIADLEASSMAAMFRTHTPAADGSLPHANSRMLRRYVVLLCLLRDAASAFAYLAALPAPVVHRDVKPSNVLLTASGSALLADFGVCKVLPPSRPVLQQQQVQLMMQQQAAAAAAAAPRVARLRAAAPAALAASRAAAKRALAAAQQQQAAPAAAGCGDLAQVFNAWSNDGDAAMMPLAKRRRSDEAAFGGMVGQELGASAGAVGMAMGGLEEEEGDLGWLNMLLEGDDDAAAAGAAYPGSAADLQFASLPHPSHVVVDELEEDAILAVLDMLPSLPPAAAAPTPALQLQSSLSMQGSWEQQQIQQQLEAECEAERAAAAAAAAVVAAGAEQPSAASAAAGEEITTGGAAHGTAHYSAPEDLWDTGYPLGPAADMFSLGYCIWEAFTARRPWADIGGGAAEVARAVGRAGARLAVPPHLSPRLRNLLGRCWSQDPSARPAPADVAGELDAEILQALRKRG